MQAVIMAGGKGTRLADLTKNEIPKPMVPVFGKPLLEWQLEKLKENGITELIMIVGYLGDRIKDYFKDGTEFGVRIEYLEEKEPLGTAGSFYYLKKYLHDQNFLVIFGDVFFDIEVERIIKFHESKDALATLFVHPNSHPFDSDLVTLDESGRVEAFDSKDNTRNYWYDNCVNAGFYVMNSEICSYVKAPEKIDLEKDLLAPLVQKKAAIYGYYSPEYIKDVGTIERINKTTEDINRGITEKKCMRHLQKGIFLDRDGTINCHKGLVFREEDFTFEEGVIEAVRMINQSDRLGIVVTNQPVVARGMCQIEDVERIHRKMSTLFGNEGVFLDAVLYCPHHPDKGYPEENPDYKIACECRKPKTGMLLQAAKNYHIDLSESWMIGDTTVDIQTGKNAGLKTALVLTGEAGKDQKYNVKPDLICKNLLEAVRKILEEDYELYE